jgi:tetratricopeptide (TPR) repeat protein
MHIWSERFDREEHDVFDIQDEITAAIVEHLKVTLLAGKDKAFGKRTTADAEAYNLYLKGLYFSARPNYESVQKALVFFRQALERDPGFAEAYAGVAFAFSSMGAISFAPQPEVFPKAKAAAEKALALDPESALAHAVLATVQYYFDLDWAAAERSFRRVLELNPSESIARGQYAWLLLSLRRFDEAAAEIKRAMVVDPLMPLVYAWSIGIHGAAGRPEEALRDFERLVQIDPTIGLAYFHAGVAYLRLGRVDEAVGILEQGRPLIASPGWSEGMIQLCRIMQGDRAGAVKMHADNLELRKRAPVSPVTLAYSSAALGDLDGAFEWLETAVRERDSIITVFHIYAEFLVPELARDPRYGALLDRLRLPR